MLSVFRETLARLGYVEGRNLEIEVRWAQGHYDQLRALAETLAKIPVDVTMALGGTATALAAKGAAPTFIRPRALLAASPAHWQSASGGSAP